MDWDELYIRKWYDGIDEGSIVIIVLPLVKKGYKWQRKV